jgi:sphingomyelin phosphodiesterase
MDSIVYRDGYGVDDSRAKGAVYAKIQIGPRRFAHVFATHLQASYAVVTQVDFGVRVKQSTALRKFITSKIGCDDCPVFLLSDMNINSGEREEYQRLIATLAIDGYELIDTLKEKEHWFTVAAGASGDGPAEKLLTPKSDWNDPTSIDYIFLYDKNGAVLKYNSEIEEFPVTGRPYQQLSDHSAVRCVVDLRQ